MRRVLVVLLLLATAVLHPAARAANDPDDVDVDFNRVASGLDSPTAIAAPRDGSRRLFIVEQAGRIRVYKSGSIRSTPYIDIRNKVLDGGERGMLGLAFHPSFASNGRFYVSYTDSGGDLRISAFRASDPDANTAPASSEDVILQVHHRLDLSNHNAGQLQFGKKYLYISTGDGGGAGDPGNNAQDKGSLLGKILRIDVDRECGDKEYCSPSTNPFYGRSKPGKGEIYHYGLRNPWRFSLDRATWYLWIADVGQNLREEINRATSKGRNFGWDCREGTIDVSDSYGGSYCDDGGFTRPLHEYSRTNGRCAIIGGYVVRDSSYAEALQGMYLYADHCSGAVWVLRRRSDGSPDTHRAHVHSGNITTFGEAESGNVYVADLQGRLYRVEGDLTG